MGLVLGDLRVSHRAGLTFLRSGVPIRAGVTNLLNKNVHPTFIAENKEPFLSDPEFSLGGRGNSIPGRAVTIGLVFRAR